MRIKWNSVFQVSRVLFLRDSPSGQPTGVSSAEVAVVEDIPALEVREGILGPFADTGHTRHP